MKKSNGDCLRGEGGQQGEGWLLAMEDQEEGQGNTAPREVKLNRRVRYYKRHQQNRKACSSNKPNQFIRLICEINLFSM